MMEYHRMAFQKERRRAAQPHPPSSTQGQAFARWKSSSNGVRLTGLSGTAARYRMTTSRKQASCSFTCESKQRNGGMQRVKASLEGKVGHVCCGAFEQQHGTWRGVAASCSPAPPCLHP